VYTIYQEKVFITPSHGTVLQVTRNMEDANQKLFMGSYFSTHLILGLHDCDVALFGIIKLVHVSQLVIKSLASHGCS
jgi:hypothetical protein